MTKKAATIPKRVRRKPAPGEAPRPRGRQPRDREALERAVRICVERGLLPQEVAELPELRGADGRPLVAWRTVYERLEKLRLQGAAVEAVPVEALAVREAEPVLELVVFCGMPASGKSSFYRERFARSHVLISKDELGGSERAERALALVNDALRGGRSAVADATHVAPEDRAPYLEIARRHGARSEVYFFDTDKAGALERNARREGAARVPDVAIHALAKRLVRPTDEEGFDAVHVVRLRAGGGFDVDVPEELALAIAEPLSPERAQRAELIRRMAADGQFDHEAAGRLAATFGCSEDEALAAILDADRVAAGKALPRHLALEAALGAYRRMLAKAEAANDWRNATMIQSRIDVLTGVVPGSKGAAAPAPGAGWVRAADVKVEVEALIRRLWGSLATWPAAQAAFRAEYARGRGASA